MADLQSRRAVTAALPDAITAFLAGGPPPPRFLFQDIGHYRAICLDSALPAQGEVVLLLAAPDGAVYASREAQSTMDLGATVAEVLTARGLRPTESTLALRLPEPLRTLSGSAVGSFTLWASPRYRASGAPEDGGVWK